MTSAAEITEKKLRNDQRPTNQSWPYMLRSSFLFFLISFLLGTMDFMNLIDNMMSRQVFLCKKHVHWVQWEQFTLSSRTIDTLFVLSSCFPEQANLSNNAESAILEAVQSQKHGDSFYFWVRMDQDPRNHTNKDFWSFCDAINAGNCRLAR